MIYIKLNQQSVYSNTRRCIFCSKVLSKRHLCSELYIYTILAPVFKRIVGFEKITLNDLRTKTLKYIKAEAMFSFIDIYHAIFKYSVYFIEDF